jgi:hypothetical protein
MYKQKLRIKEKGEPMTQKEAKELTLELWGYLAEHPECEYKEDTPLWDKVKNLSADCPLCAMFNSLPSRCRCCPLDEAGENCGGNDSLWNMWSKTSFQEERKEAAMRIVEIVTEWEPEGIKGKGD